MTTGLTGIAALEAEMRDRISAKNAEIERLQIENWQIKGALGYPVPGHIMPGPFKCGMCEARAQQTSG